MNDFIIPDWPAPTRVRALVTTRSGGVSIGPYASFNLATHVNDEPLAVTENRRRLRAMLPAEPRWLNQVHGCQVAAAAGCGMPDADASVARAPGQVCVVLTADCLPVLFCDRAGTVVAAAHAGWRGLAGGVLEASLATMGVPPADVLAWLGPAIGPDAFEVGDEVRATFMAQHADAASAFRPGAQPGKWMADIYALARLRLRAAGVADVTGGGLCTVSDAQRFFSYRRDRECGRMASLVWLE